MNIMQDTVSSAQAVTTCPYFKSIGKSNVSLICFYQHADFLCVGMHMQGLPSRKTKLSENRGKGVFWQFIRLVGTAYFKKAPCSVSVSLYDHENPLATCFNSIDPSLSDNERHYKWLEIIRNCGWRTEIVSEEERVPSVNISVAPTGLLQLLDKPTVAVIQTSLTCMALLPLPETEWVASEQRHIHN